MYELFIPFLEYVGVQPSQRKVQQYYTCRNYVHVTIHIMYVIQCVVVVVVVHVLLYRLLQERYNPTLGNVHAHVYVTYLSCKLITRVM